MHIKRKKEKEKERKVNVMHFSVMVPVKVPVITDEAIQRAEAARLYMEAMQQAPQDSEKNLMDNVIFKCNMQHALSISTPFSSAVAEAVAEVMEPYSQDTDDPRFCEFEDETEDLKNSFETGTIECISYNGKYYGLYHFKNFRKCSDGVVREITANGKEFLSAKAQQMIAVTIPVKEFYGTFRKYAREQSNYCKEKKAWGYWHNPMCFWDWYSIGGRWDYGFLVKEDCEDVVRGIPGAGVKDDSAPVSPPGYKWTSAARKKDICVDEMTKWSIAETRAKYDKYAAMWNGTEPLGEHIQQKEDGLYYWGGRVFDPTKSIDDVLVSHNYQPETAVFRLFHSYLDTINTKPGDGEYGYYDSDCCEDWKKQFMEFWAQIEDDDVIVTVDCHM